MALSRSRRPLAVLLGLVALGALAGAATLEAMRPPEPVIAVVDLNKVLADLDEADDRFKEFQADVLARSEELKALQKTMEEEAAKVELLPEDQKAEQIRKVQLIRWDLEARRVILERLSGVEEAEILAELSIAILEAVGSVSEQNGYTIVLPIEADQPLPTNNPQAISKAVLDKKFLYVDPGHDISQEVVTYMNNQYAASAN